MNFDKFETSQPTTFELPLPNIPSYEEILRISNLSPDQFSINQYEEYTQTLLERASLISEQVRYLHEQIEKFAHFITDKTDPVLTTRYEQTRSALESILSGFLHTTSQSDLFPLSGNSVLLEEQLDRLSTQVRNLKFAVADLYMSGNYQAASNYTSREKQIGIGQQVDADLYTEYARWDLDPKQAEDYFDEFIEKPSSAYSQTLLFGSGMATVTTVLTLARNLHPAGHYLFGSQMYFENNNQAERIENELLFQNFDMFDEGDSADLEHKMKNDPSVIFIEPIGNSKNLPRVDLSQVLSAPTTCDRRLIILDTTLLGPSFNMKPVIEQLDSQSVLIVISSLQKLYQEGDGVASAGIASVISKDIQTVNEVSEKLKNFRGMLGTNITPHNLKLVQKIKHSQVKAYAEQINKNTEELASSLKNKNYECVEAVVSATQKNISDSGIPVFYIHFKQPIGQDFVNTLIDEAAVNNLQLTDGASFGFRNTRLMVIGGDQYAVRICPGIENTRQLAVLKNALDTVLKNL